MRKGQTTTAAGWRGMTALARLCLLGSAAGAAEPTVYTVKDLLEPCIEGDADARWGAAAEAECEQYILGFTDAIVEFGAVGKEKNICLPDQNRADEVRWAFMRWAHKNFDQRGQPAVKGLMATLKQSFKCK